MSYRPDNPFDRSDWRIAPQKVKPRDLVVLPASLSPPSSLWRLRFVDETFRPDASCARIGIRTCRGDTVTVASAPDYLVRIPSFEMRKALESGRKWLLGRERDFVPDESALKPDDNTRHPFDIGYFRYDPILLERGNIVADFSRPDPSPAYRIRVVEQTLRKDDGRRFAVQFFDGEQTSWKVADSPGDEPAVEGHTVRIWRDQFSDMLEYGVGLAFDDEDDAQHGGKLELSGCPICGALHGPREPCV